MTTKANIRPSAVANMTMTIMEFDGKLFSNDIDIYIDSALDALGIRLNQDALNIGFGTDFEFYKNIFEEVLRKLPERRARAKNNPAN